MVQSQASTVDEYLAQASAECRSHLTNVRDTARRILADHQERMQWGRPVYALADEVRFGFAEQKRFVSLYFTTPKVLDEHAAAIAGLPRGKRCLHLPKSGRIDPGALEALVTAVARQPAAERS
jgi:uncharacterized protein YdhG (YjbR/CyaY superfamily)